MTEPAYVFPRQTDGQDWPIQGEWTYEDYLRLPDDGRRYEVIRGFLYVSPRRDGRGGLVLRAPGVQVQGGFSVSGLPELNRSPSRAMLA
jgi:hypothetical protein